MSYAQNNSVIGKWNVISSQTGTEIGVVEIYQHQGEIQGKVIAIHNPKDQNRSCKNCIGSYKNQPLLGLTILRGLKKKGSEYSGGTILDPKYGKYYSCYITLENDNKLKVRGYLGISLFGKTHYWHRVK